MIDTHVHHWELGRFRYPWLDDAAFDDLRKDYFPADYRADAAEMPVDGWVHIQAEVDHQLDPVAETAWVESLAEEASAAGLPGPLACVVYADLRAANVRDLLSRHCSYPLTRGVRQEAWFDPGSTRADIPREDLLSDPAWQEGYRALAEFGLSFDLLVWPTQLPRVAAIAADNPAVPLVLEHLGLPDPYQRPGSAYLAGRCGDLGSASAGLRQVIGVQLARQSARRTGRASCGERTARGFRPRAVDDWEQLSRRASGRRFRLALPTGARQPARSVQRATCCRPHRHCTTLLSNSAS